MGFSFCIFVIFCHFWPHFMKNRTKNPEWGFSLIPMSFEQQKIHESRFLPKPSWIFFLLKNCNGSFCHCRQETTLVGWSRFVGATDVKRYDERSDQSYKITLHITLNLLFHVTEELTSMPTTPMKLKTFRQWRFISEVIEKWNRSLENDLTQSVNRSPLRICQNAYTFLT